MTEPQVAPKIVIIGAGSLEFSSRLTADCLSYPALAGAHFALVDTDAERLSYAGRIFDRIVEAGGYEASCSLHSQVTEALPGAQFVIVSILVGGYEAIEAEIDIPMKYGVSQAIGDTLTPGGIMRCLRTLPVQTAIAQHIMALCPDALVLNYTNPMSMLCEGMLNAAPSLNLVGLCHSVQSTTEQWAKRLNQSMTDVTFACAGLNHQAWITRFEVHTEDQLPVIRKLAVNQRFGATIRQEWNTSNTLVISHGGVGPQFRIFVLVSQIRGRYQTVLPRRWLEWWPWLYQVAI